MKYSKYIMLKKTLLLYNIFSVYPGIFQHFMIVSLPNNIIIQQITHVLAKLQTIRNTLLSWKFPHS